MRKQQKLQKAKKSRGLGAWLPLSAAAILAVTLATKCSQASRHGVNDLTTHSSSAAGLMRLHQQLGDPRFTVASVVKDEIQDGIWTVDDSIWSFESCEVSTSALKSVMSQPPLGKSPVESTLTEHLALLDLIPIERATVERIEGLTIRSIDFGTVRASMIYRESSGQNFILSANVANQIDAQRWQVITLKPRMVAARNLDHLLPLSGVRAGVSQRVSKSGQLQCEIVETSSSIGELVRGWKTAGWLIQDIDATQPAEMNMSCCKGNQSIQVQARQQVSEAKLTLVLTALHNL